MLKQHCEEIAKIIRRLLEGFYDLQVEGIENNLLILDDVDFETKEVLELTEGEFDSKNSETN